MKSSIKLVVLNTAVKAAPAVTVPSFTRAAEGILEATETRDTATTKFSETVVMIIQQFVDACKVAGIPRDKKNVDRIGEEIRNNSTMRDAWEYTGSLQKTTVTEYAQGAMRAYYHDVPFTATLKNNPDFKIPNADGKTRALPGGTKSGAIKSTTRAELDKTLCKLLTQARLMGLNEFAADILDLAIDSLEGFKEAAESEAE